MALTAGARLGPYEITAQIGVGGMGEVYRATDTNLGRQVAIKVLPDTFAHDPERLARFEREAKTLASLNHANIAIIHGLERADGIRALVMELVEGPTLADRIAQGPVPIDEALPIAKQIAEALEAAHEQGIIHRDLKPANVKVREDGTVKVLDFGLAKAVEPVAAMSSSQSMSPTITTPAMTQLGVILGTAAYMSPEQAKGRPADKRSDVWAFGCVLYEMLSGKRAFSGDDVSETLADVLRVEPAWAKLPSALSPSLLSFLKRCLHKDPRQRLGDMHDMRLALDGGFDVSASPSEASRAPEPARSFLRRALPILTVATVVGVAAASAAWSMRPAEPRAVTRSIHELPEGRSFRGLGQQIVSIAPDGRYFIYSGAGGLYLRPMDALEDRLIAGTERFAVTGDVIVSPDGLSVAFFALTGSGGELVRLPVAGGAIVKIADIAVAFGGTWGDDGLILYAQPGGIWEVSENGGNPRRVIGLQSDELAFRPQRLPGGDWILFTVTRSLGGLRWDMAEIVVENVASGERRVLRQSASDARYLRTGHVVYAYENVLYAMPFDVDRLAVTGQAAPVVQGVRRVEAPGGNTGAAFYSISNDGTLVYAPGTSSAAGAAGLVWVERDGTRTAIGLSPGQYAHPRVSPDGKWLAVERQSGDTVDIWIYETSGITEMRRLTDGGRNRYPVWSRDGAFVAFQSDRDGDHGIFLQRADGTGSKERLTTPDGKSSHIPEDWSPKEDVLAFTMVDGPSSELWMWRGSDRKAARFGTLQSVGPFDAVFSPDGRWLAYSQRDLLAAITRVATYVHSVQSNEIRYQLGRAEDQFHHPLWSPNGRQLVYFPAGGAAVAVDVRTEPSFGFGRPTALPGDGLPINVSPGSLLNHDVAPDGRFVTVADAGTADGDAANRNGIVIVQNWTEELKRLVPMN